MFNFRFLKFNNGLRSGESEIETRSYIDPNNVTVGSHHPIRIPIKRANGVQHDWNDKEPKQATKSPDNPRCARIPPERSTTTKDNSEDQSTDGSRQSTFTENQLPGTQSNFI